MNTRVCDKCGWVYPATSRVGTCIVCGTVLTHGACCECGEYAEELVEGKFCRSCFNSLYNTPAQRRRRAKEYKKYAAIYAAWLGKIKSLPKDYPTLTESQWLEACQHFNGCAYCGSDSIDARSYFIEFSEGGRYCDWNIVPACERCASAARIQKDPFKRLVDANKKPALRGIINYLEVRLDAAVARHANSDKQSDR